MTTATGRMLALGRAEATLLLRNRTALFTALLLPPAMVVGLSSALQQQAKDNPGLDVHASVISGLAGVILLFVVYYTLTASYVARRGELVLKRLRTGEARDAEILLGTSVPAVALALLEVVLLSGIGAVVFDLPVPANPVLLLAGVLLSLAVLIALAALSSVFTRTVESAGLTTLPLLLVSQLGSGLMFPLEVMPDGLARICQSLPTTPGFQLIRLGWFGTDGSAPPTGFLSTWGEAWPHLLLGVAWTVAAAWAARRYFRWEPRR
ncbi:ABC transporter permease [Kitasatospora sp. NPDC048365]|uniref:ABC transporter permease n=1 Tax=Kitasatospora sp. NPDC048365 TaxID=3364050 RepID=UPI00371001F9